MKKLVPTRLDPLLLAVALAAVFVSSAAGQTVTWQALPFPVTSDWPGPFGNPAAINTNSIVLQGQPARTVESFAAPFAIQCDAQLASRFTDDGAFTIYLLEPGQPPDTDPMAGLAVRLVYSNTGDFGSMDRLEISDLGGATLWSDPTFHLAGGTTYRLMLQVSGAGALHLDIDGTSYPIDGSVVFPYAQAQIQLGGWQPNDTWTVSNFTLAVVPEPAAARLALRMEPGMVSLTVTGTPGAFYSFQYVETLPTTNWITWTNLYLPSASFTLFHQRTDGAARFYRAVGLQ